MRLWSNPRYWMWPRRDEALQRDYQRGGGARLLASLGGCFIGLPLAGILFLAAWYDRNLLAGVFGSICLLFALHGLWLMTFGQRSGPSRLYRPKKH